MDGNGIFNGQILADKLAKLNNSRQSIETLSHWCIFHMKKAKLVVETWERQFYCSPRDQRLSFLYLANDILQNSRRKGMEFVDEFWKVLPNALHDFIQKGDEFGRKAALRLVDIWEERKVFGSHGQALKDEFLGNRNRNGKSTTCNLKSPSRGEMLEKIISGYDQVNNSPVHEDVIFGKCATVISCIEKLEKESGGNFDGPGVLEELRGHRDFLRESIEELKLAESSRATLLLHLTEALHEQEFKFGQVRNQLQVAQSRYEQVEQLLTAPKAPLMSDQQLAEVSPPALPPSSSFSDISPTPDHPPDSAALDTALSDPTDHGQPNQQGPLADTTSEENRTAAEVSASLTSSTSSSAQIQSTIEDSVSDGNKRPRLDTGGLSSIVPCYMPQQPSPLPNTLQPLSPPIPLSVAPIPPSTGGPMTGFPFTYGLPMPPLQLPPYPLVGMPLLYPGPPPYPFSFQGPDNGALFGQQPPQLTASPPPMPQE